jgi:O-antigen ligase
MTNSLGLLLLLLASCCVLIKVPFIDLAIHNFLLPSISIAIILVNLDRAFLLKRKKIIIYICLLVIWCFICLFFSQNKSIAFIYTIKYCYYYVVIFFALLLVTKNPSNNHKLCNLVIFFLTVVGILGIIEYFLPEFWLFELLKNPSFHPRISSILQNPNSFGVLMAIAAILNLLVKRERASQKIYLLISESIFIVSLVLSGSRNAWLVFAIAFCLLLRSKIIKFKKILIFLSIFLLVILLFPVAKYRFGLGELQFIPAIDLLKNQIETQLPNPQGTAFSRLLLWKLALNETIKRPITGLGVGVFTEYTSIPIFGKPGFNAHNLFLNVAVDLGIPGLLLVIIGTVKLWYKSRLSEPLINIPLAMFFCSQLVDFFIYDLTFAIVEIMFICLALNYKTTSSREKVLMVEKENKKQGIGISRFLINLKNVPD